MIIYGLRSRVIGTSQASESCEACGPIGGIRLNDPALLSPVLDSDFSNEP